jgi:cytochrome P450
MAFDPTDSAFIEDPYPVLAELRESGPVVRSDEWGLWLITRHAEVLAAQRDRRLGRVRAGHAEPEDLRPIRELQIDLDWTPYYRVERHSLLMLEPPEHTRIRSLVTKAFTPSRVRRLRPVIEQIAASLLDGLGDHFELLADYAQPYSIRVIAGLLGAPVDDADRLLEWSHAIVKMYELDPDEAQARAAVAASTEFTRWVLDLIDERRTGPRDDLVTALCQAETDEGVLSDGEIVSTVILLLNAGHEATVNTMGNGLTAILGHGGWDRIARGEVGAALAVEEMLRWDPPLQLFERWVLTDDYRVAGTPIPAGDKIAMLFGAANRDPRAFDRPDDFLVGRGDSSHISFGAGVHYCLGAPLARLELEVAVDRLARRFPRLVLVDEPRRIPAFVIRGYQSVVVANSDNR